METRLFSKINIELSIRESELLTASDFAKLMQAQDLEHLSLLLSTTTYPLSVAELQDLNQIEKCLMRYLIGEYQWAYAETPDKKVVSLFATRYIYHNLKVLFKARATQQNLSHLLIPIGPWPMEVLEHVVATLESEILPPEMVEEIAAIWNEYEGYQDLRALEIGTDLAYFKDLKRLAGKIGEPVLEQTIRLMIDFYNVITVKRARLLDKPQSFMLQLLSDEGSLSAKDFIDLEAEHKLATWFDEVNPNTFALNLKPYETKMKDGSITALELEYLSDFLQSQLLDQARFTTEGPLILARYLLACEYEVKNLRLLLSAFSNQMPMESVKERVRPFYE